MRRKKRRTKTKMEIEKVGISVPSKLSRRPYSSVVERQSCKLEVRSSILRGGMMDLRFFLQSHLCQLWPIGKEKQLPSTISHFEMINCRSWCMFLEDNEKLAAWQSHLWSFPYLFVFFLSSEYFLIIPLLLLRARARFSGIEWMTEREREWEKREKPSLTQLIPQYSNARRESVA